MPADNSPQDQLPPSTRQERVLGPFLGVQYALDAEFIGDNNSPDMQNVQVEDGRISIRYGFLKRAPAHSGFVAVYGFDFVSAFDTNGNEVAYYLVLADCGSGILPWAVDPTTLAWTAITNAGVTPTALTTPAYGSQPGFRTQYFNNYAYVISQSESSSTANVYQHAIGTYTSWLQLSNPKAPTKKPVFGLYFDMVDKSALAPKMYFTSDGTATGTGIANSAITLSPTSGNGALTFPGAGAALNGGINLNHDTPSGAGPSVPYQASETVTINFMGTDAGGSQDWTYRDRIVIKIDSLGVDIDETSVAVTVTNSAGTSFTPTTTTVDSYADDATELKIYWIICDFTNKSPRTTFAAIHSMEIAYNVISVCTTARLSQNNFTIEPLILGLVDIIPVDSSGNPAALTLGYSNYNSTTGLESPITQGATQPVTFLNGQFLPENGTTTPPRYLGARLKLYLNSSGSTSGYDTYNIYAQYLGSTSWYQVDSVPIHTACIGGPEASSPNYEPLSGTFSTKVGNTGNGTCGAITVTAGSRVGTYTFTATTATNFTATDPAGNSLSALTVGTAYAAGGLSFTITAGGTAYVSGDKFYITVIGSGTMVFMGVTYDATYSYLWNWNDAQEQPAQTPASGTFENAICCAPFNGSMVWGFKGGGIAGTVTGNIQFSEIGNATTLYSNASSTQLDPNNVGAAANLTLADNGADDPIAMFPINSSLFIVGSKGVYFSSGTNPDSQSPFKRLPTSLGCAGQYACCRWHDATGNPAVVFMSAKGEGLYLAQEDPYFLNTVHSKITELTTEVRGLIFSFLLNGSLANLKYVTMGVDETRDALWVVCQNRYMVQRRPSMLDQQRHWETGTWTIPSSANVAFISFNTEYRMRWIRSTGEIDENEWDSVNNLWIVGPSGLTRDGCSYSGSTLVAGSAPTPIYYKTKVYTGDNRRIDVVRIDRQLLTDTPTIVDYCTRETSGESHTVASGKYNVRFSAGAIGKEHQFKITLADGSGYIRRLVVEEVGPLGREPLA